MLATLCRLTAQTFFREIVLEGRENLPARGPVIFTPNHPNALLDPMLLQFLSPPFCLRFVAKAPLFRIPVLGWIMRQMRAIPVVRRLDSDRAVDYTFFFTACVQALTAGDSIVIFPEGRSLPQPSLAPLRTGAARLFFLAYEKGVKASIVPIGLNYERGAIFRTSVLVSIAPPINTVASGVKHATDPEGAVRELTAAIARSLEQHVFQAETFRDRELLLLLERLYAEDEHDDSWRRRYQRLKQFEAGLTRLRGCCPHEIDRLRQLLMQYERVSVSSGMRKSAARAEPSRWLKLAFLGTLGTVIAIIGWMLNWLPYKVCGVLVRLTRRDEAEAATYKIAYSLFLFPLTYLVEGLVVSKWLGKVAATVFAALILPLSYFTLRFFEWRKELGARLVTPSAWFGESRWHRAPEQIARLRLQIVAEVDLLAARPELRFGTSETEASPPQK